MMRMWASSRVNEIATAPVRMNGFTLLELLVVLALGAALVAVVMPRLASTVQAIQISGERAEVSRVLASMAVNARLSGKPVELTKGEVLSDGFPPEWQAVVDEQLRITVLGVCSGSTVTVIGPTGPEKWKINSPDCTVSY